MRSSQPTARMIRPSVRGCQGPGRRCGYTSPSPMAVGSTHGHFCSILGYRLQWSAQLCDTEGYGTESNMGDRSHANWSAR